MTLPAQGSSSYVPIRRTMHLSSVIPANDTRESVFGNRNFPPRQRGSNLGTLSFSFPLRMEQDCVPGTSVFFVSVTYRTALLLINTVKVTLL